ncbi:12144_t:CDS:2, partial [Gigaspora margarita]
NIWEAINNALQGPQTIWLIGVEDGNQTISQFVLEDGRTFRTWKKHTDIINACKELFEDAVDWQFWKGIISEEKKQESLESLKVVNLAEQVFGTNHAGSRLANEINKWYPTLISVHENIKQSCVEHGHGGRWNTPDYCIQDVVCIDMKSCYPASICGQGECSLWFNRFGHPTHYLVRVAVNGKLPKDNITGFAQAAILEDLTVGEFIQGSKIDEKRLTHQLVTDEGELDFLIKDCTDAGTFAGREKCSLGFILTYYEGHQPQYTHLRASILAYAHINLLEMLRRFEPNKVVRIATDSIYVRKEALYKIENVPAFFKQEKAKDLDLCPHTYPPCAMCSDPFVLSMAEYKKWINEFQKTKMPLVKYECGKHKPFIYKFCFGEWFYTPNSYAHSHQPEKQEIQEIQPGQWCDKGEKIYGSDENIIYWPKNRYWKSIKNIPDSIAPTIHDPITRCQKSYLNGGGGSVGEWTPERMGEKKFSQVVIWDK